jgi:hypothetical protein
LSNPETQSLIETLSVTFASLFINDQFENLNEVVLNALVDCFSCLIDLDVHIPNELVESLIDHENLVNIHSIISLYKATIQFSNYPHYFDKLINHLQSELTEASFNSYQKGNIFRISLPSFHYSSISHLIGCVISKFILSHDDNTLNLDKLLSLSSLEIPSYVFSYHADCVHSIFLVLFSSQTFSLQTFFLFLIKIIQQVKFQYNPIIYITISLFFIY